MMRRKASSSYVRVQCAAWSRRLHALRVICYDVLVSHAACRCIICQRVDTWMQGLGGGRIHCSCGIWGQGS